MLDCEIEKEKKQNLLAKNVNSVKRDEATPEACRK